MAGVLQELENIQLIDNKTSWTISYDLYYDIFIYLITILWSYYLLYYTVAKDSPFGDSQSSLLLGVLAFVITSPQV